MRSLRTRIRQSLANPVLQAALDANAERRLRGRAQAFASLPDAETRRQQAHAVRGWVIEHLDEMLERFLTHLRENGIHVHRAQNGEEARRIVIDILSAHAVGKKRLLIAKSKSMVSEEIELNHALEAAGHCVVETDLGEYIVQLRGERPAHIITPAVHLRRQEVGALFHEKLGIPYTEEIAALTQTARRTLRQVFLRA
ncbi:MAG: LUD domain-containing protein, partial [Anaerolineales bacterium]